MSNVIWRQVLEKVYNLSTSRLKVEDDGSLPAGASTSANQSAIITILNAIAAYVSSASKQDTGNASLSSIDTKLTANATTTKQDTGNASLGSIDTKLTSQATATNQTSTNTKLDTIHTDLGIVEGKQDTGNTSLASILTNLALPLSMKFGDSVSLDSFGRLRVSNGITIFDSQLTYDLQPLLFEQITSGSGATVTHDSTNRCVLMTFSSTATGGKAFMQSYECMRYIPGRSQKAVITFNFIEQKANTLKFAAYGDGTNGVEFQNNGTTNQFVLFSGSSAGNQTVIQSAWNVDKFNGLGPSGLTLDITKTQILGIDMQALYVGRVRIGFDINGVLYIAHQFLASNILVNAYIQSANLPIRVGMTCTGTVSTTMNFICSSVQNEGVVQDAQAYPFAAEGVKQAPNGSFEHILSIRPTTTFNSITNRIKILMQNASFVATSASPVIYQVVLGQALSGTTTFTSVNSSYSGMEYNTLGSVSGSPAIILQQGYVSQSNVAISTPLTNIRAPLTLDSAGAVRSLGTLSLLVWGLGGNVNMRASFNWNEVR